MVASDNFLGKREAFNFIKKETLAQMFSCEFCEISNNTFSYRTPPVAASEIKGFRVPRCFIKNRKIYKIDSFDISKGPHAYDHQIGWKTLKCLGASLTNFY